MIDELHSIRIDEHASCVSVCAGVAMIPAFVMGLLIIIATVVIAAVQMLRDRT
jgi:hypothetical protein